MDLPGDLRGKVLLGDYQANNGWRGSPVVTGEGGGGGGDQGVAEDSLFSMVAYTGPLTAKHPTPTTASQFFIHTREAANNKCNPFGKVIEGLTLLRNAISRFPPKNIKNVSHRLWNCHPCLTLQFLAVPSCSRKTVRGSRWC